jgi:hypothetical protein
MPACSSIGRVNNAAYTVHVNRSGSGSQLETRRVSAEGGGFSPMKIARVQRRKLPVVAHGKRWQMAQARSVLDICDNSLRVARRVYNGDRSDNKSRRISASRFSSSQTCETRGALATRTGRDRAGPQREQMARTERVSHGNGSLFFRLHLLERGGTRPRFILTRDASREFRRKREFRFRREAHPKGPFPSCDVRKRTFALQTSNVQRPRRPLLFLISCFDKMQTLLK